MHASSSEQHGGAVSPRHTRQLARAKCTVLLLRMPSRPYHVLLAVQIGEAHQDPCCDQAQDAFRDAPHFFQDILRGNARFGSCYQTFDTGATIWHGSVPAHVMSQSMSVEGLDVCARK